MPALRAMLDGAVRPLVRGHPTEEQHVGAVLVATAVADREVRGVDSVVDDPGDGDVGSRPPLRVGDGHDRDPIGVGPVDVGQLLVEGPVDGGGHGKTGIVLRVERAHDGVVVDHVTVTDRLIGVDDVPELGHGAADPGALGRRQHPLAGYRAGRVARGEEEYVVAGVLQTRGPADRPPVRSPRTGGGGWGSTVGRSFRSAWRDSSIPAGRVGSPDATAAWPSGLGRGLQSPVRRFDSARRLHAEHRGMGAVPTPWGRPHPVGSVGLMRGAPTRSGRGRGDDGAVPGGVGVPSTYGTWREGVLEVSGRRGCNSVSAQEGEA